MKSNDLKEYKRHIRKQKKYITSENFKELGELINGEIGLLTHQCVSDLWMSLAIAVLTRCAEYLNFAYCIYGNKKQSKFPKTPHLIHRNLSRLLHFLEENTELYLYEPYSDQVWDMVRCLLEGEVYLQEPAHWFITEDYFEMKDGKISTELKTDVTKELIALECHSDRIDIDIDKSDCDDIEILALSVLKAIRNVSPTIDMILVQKRTGYGFGKSKYLITWLAKNGYIQKILNEDEEDLGYGIREINYTVEEISEILESKKQ